jgi:hypothetical protein
MLTVIFLLNAITLQPRREQTESVLFVGGGCGAGQVKPLTGGVFISVWLADIAVNNIDIALREGDLRSLKLALNEKEWKNKLNKEREYADWLAVYTRALIIVNLTGN